MKSCTFLERIWFGRTVSTSEHRPRILIADDHDDFSTLVKAYLAPQGVAVDTASTGYEALSLATQVVYDLILVDIQMPGLDGYQVTTRLRATGYDRPILAVTAHAMAPYLDEALRAGCDAVYTKPVSLSVLRAAILSSVAPTAP